LGRPRRNSRWREEENKEKRKREGRGPVAGQPAWSTWPSSHAGGRSGGVRLPPVVCSLAGGREKRQASRESLPAGGDGRRRSSGGWWRVEAVLGRLRQHLLLQQRPLPTHVQAATSPVLYSDGGRRRRFPEVLDKKKDFLRTRRRKRMRWSQEGGRRASGMGAFFCSAWW
jgi:hypothetical protein